MAERVMTEKQIKAHRKRMQEMRGKKGGKASAPALKTRHRKVVDPDKTKEYETRFCNVWVAIKELESRVIQLEAEEE